MPFRERCPLEERIEMFLDYDTGVYTVEELTAPWHMQVSETVHWGALLDGRYSPDTSQLLEFDQAVERDGSSMCLIGCPGPLDCRFLRL